MGYFYRGPLGCKSITLSPDGRFLAFISRMALGPRWSENPREIEDLGWDNRPQSLGKAPTRMATPQPCSSCRIRGYLVGINDMTLLVWPVPNLGEPGLIRNDSRKDFTATAFHPSGRHLYVASNDATVHVFETATWECIGRFTWQIGKLKALAVMPVGWATPAVAVPRTARS